MEQSVDRDSYWTLVEAAIWIRERDVSRVLSVNDPATQRAIISESKQAMEELPKNCRSGRVRAVGRRCIGVEAAIKVRESIGKPLLWRSSVGQPSDVTENIPSHDWVDLEWEPSVDGRVTGNLRSKLLGRKAWVMVQFLQSDVMREWPSFEMSNEDLKSSIPRNGARSPSKLGLTQSAPDGKRRGRKPVKLKRVKEAMMHDISQGKRTLNELQNALEKDLAAEYHVSRDTARKALQAVVAEFGENSILDK